MQLEIISVGNELLNGNTINTNASYMSRHAYEIGIPTYAVQTVGDERSAIFSALDHAFNRSDVVLITGGLGPTHDDITKQVVSEYFNDKLVFSDQIYRDVKAKFTRRGIPMPEINRSQAIIPENADLIDNPVGTALGMIFRRENKIVCVLPGVPVEMKTMMKSKILNLLKDKCPDRRFEVHYFRTTGIPESAIYEKIENELNKFNSYEIAFLPKFTGVDIRVIRKENDTNDVKKFSRFLEMLNNNIGDYIYANKDLELEAVVGGLLKEKKLTIAVSESLTGGLIQNKLTDVPGSSEYFLGGVVAYSNESKINLLGVRENSLLKFGAVSETVAEEMAAGAQKFFSTDIAISTTGIAGPTGATPQKAIGLIFIGLAVDDKITVRKFQFGNDRWINKARSTQAALEMVRRAVLGITIN